MTLMGLLACLAFFSPLFLILLLFNMQTKLPSKLGSDCMSLRIGHSIGYKSKAGIEEIQKIQLSIITKYAFIDCEKCFRGIKLIDTASHKSLQMMQNSIFSNHFNPLCKIINKFQLSLIFFKSPFERYHSIQVVSPIKLQ